MTANDPGRVAPGSSAAGRIAKAELHVHLEGTVGPDLIRRLAAGHGIALPDDLFAGDRGYRWSDFVVFLRVYDAVSGVIRTIDDYRLVTRAYLEGLAVEGAIYAELTVSPDHAAAAGLNYADQLAGIAQGVEEARAATGIEARLIVVGVRHRGVAAVMDVARRVVAEPHPLVTGFGLVGDEANWPPGLFAEAFRAAAEEAGLACTVHAGEWAGPDSIRAALALPVTRLGHGVRAIEDPDLVAEIAERGIVLEVCPGSNVATGLYPDRSRHPFPALRDAGVRVTLNSDDPPYFDTSLGREYAEAAALYGLEDDDLLGLTRTAIAAAFVDDATRARLLDRLDEAGATA
ncbi:MAG: adenosine deaminase [Azospirillaceae bacterium]